MNKKQVSIYKWFHASSEGIESLAKIVTTTEPSRISDLRSTLVGRVVWVRCSIGPLLARSSRNRLVSPGEYTLVASHALLLGFCHYLHFYVFGITAYQIKIRTVEILVSML